MSIDNNDNAKDIDYMSKVKELSKKGYELLRSNNFEKAERVFFEGLEIQENNSYILVGLGELYRKQKMFQKSVDYYKRVLGMDSENKFALLGLGDAYRGLKDRQKSLEVWLKYIEIHPRDLSILTRVGDIYRQIEDYDKAEKYYNRSLKIEPNYKFALMGLGDIHYKTGDIDGALPYFERLVEKNEGLINILTIIGNIYRKKTDFEKALEYFRKAYSADNKNPFAIFGLADSLRGLKRYKEALGYWLMFEKDAQKDPKILTRIGDCYLNIGMIDKAYDFYSRVTQIEWNKFSLYGLARIDKTRGKYEDALDKYEKILAVEPEDERTVYLMYRTLLTLDREEDAKNFLKQKGREDFMGRSLLGVVLPDSGFGDEE